MVARARLLQARVLPRGWLDVLRQVALGPEDLTLARLAAETGWSDHGVEIRLDDLTIRAEAFPATPEPR